MKPHPKHHEIQTKDVKTIISGVCEGDVWVKWGEHRTEVSHSQSDEDGGGDTISGWPRLNVFGFSVSRWHSTRVNIVGNFAEHSLGAGLPSKLRATLILRRKPLYSVCCVFSWVYFRIRYMLHIYDVFRRCTLWCEDHEVVLFLTLRSWDMIELTFVNS